MSQPLKLLVISFYFPPYDKVGGRRWAKHCKYLQEQGIDFHVLAGDFSGTSPWDQDLSSFRDKISRIKLVRKNFPYHLRKLPGNIIQKMIWKASLIFWERKKKRLRGNYRDLSIGNEEAFYAGAKALIEKKNCNTVILSVGPFTYSSIISRLKGDFPKNKFVIDYRDYWEDGFPGLTAAQQAQEQKLQKNVLKGVDLVLSPNDEMQAYYRSQFSQRSYKLPHCFDEEDLLKIQASPKQSGMLKLLYGGAFYSDLSDNIRLVKNFIDKVSEKKKIKAEFYVSIKGYEEELIHPAITRKGFLSSQEYFNLVKGSQGVILLLPPNRVNAMSSKFFELVAMRVPILYFGGQGQVSDYIQQNHLGFCITGNNIDQQVSLWLENIENENVPDRSYDITKHSFRFQTKLLTHELNTLLNE
jgi:hypothetical protein